MDRPKHRRFLLIGFALFAVAGVLLFARQWRIEPGPLHASADTSARQLVPAQPEKHESPVITSAEQSAPTPKSAPRTAAATGFRGKVIDAVTREPVREFQIQLILAERARNLDEAPQSRNFKSASGRFLWPNVAEGKWRAAVVAAGYQQFNVDEVQITPGKSTQEFVIPLLRGYPVRGRVFELSTGAGIAEATITFQPANGEQDYLRRRPRATSQDDGSFLLDGVPPGEVILSVSAREHADRSVGLVVDEKTPAQEIALSTGGTIAGSVTTAAGAPIKGSLNLLGPEMNFGTETDATGHFRFQNMRAGRYRLSVSTAEGSATLDIALHRDEIQDGIVLVLAAGQSIRGVVRGLRPEQLDDVRIMVNSDSRRGSISGRADQRGAYALTGVPPGHAVLSVWSRSQEFEKSVEVPAGQDLTLDLVFAAGARLSGRVTQGGQPVVSKMVYMRPIGDTSERLYRSMTSAEGQYEIEGLPPGEYFMRAYEDISRRITVAGDAVLNIDIPSVQLSARVVEDGGAVPVVGANVFVRGSAPETARVRSDRQTDDFGQVSLTGIDNGDIVLMVYKAGYELHRETISYSAPITDKTITLRKSAGVEVRVKPGSRRFPRGFTLTQSLPGNDYVMDLWMPLDREGLCHVPAALAGARFEIGRFSGKPIVFEEWDGQPFELP